MKTSATQAIAGRTGRTAWSGGRPAGLVLIVCGALSWAPKAGAEEPFDVRDLAIRAAGIDLRPGFGLRVGGYGLREVEADEGVDWLSCRMDGLGVFGTLAFTPHLFTELSFDLYQATSGTVEDEGMDRISMQVLGAFGLRAFPDAIVSPVVQLGMGFEHTSIDALSAGADSHGFYPLGFLGGGAEVNVSGHFRLGANLRLYAMTAFALVSEVEQVDGSSVFGAEIEPEAALAGQLQLWMRYDL